jgi:hypothetical protein
MDCLSKNRTPSQNQTHVFQQQQHNAWHARDRSLRFQWGSCSVLNKKSTMTIISTSNYNRFPIGVIIFSSKLR